MKRRYLKGNLIFQNNKLTNLIGFFATVEESQVWFLNDSVNRTKHERDKLKKSVDWLTYRIKECDKPVEEQEHHVQKSFDIDYIKDNVTPDKFIGTQPVKISQDKEWYCCPLHNEITPSFCWNVSEKYYKCFGCQESGDIIDLYMKINNYTFQQACKDLENIF